MTSPLRWESPPLSTASRRAEGSYRRGIAALVATITDAREALLEAVALDPGFFVAHVGLGVTGAIEGRRYEPPIPPARALRGERQHAEIVAMHFAACGDRAADLRREHLLEYPGDLLIVWLPAVRPARQAGTGA
jgi:hypothetical protein